MKNSNQFSQINDVTNTNKKKVIIYVIGVFILLTLAVGISYAAWTYDFLGVKTNTISTTDVSLKFLESSEELINITNALPLTDNEGKEQEDTYDFAVTSKTTRDTNIEYNINIEKLSVDNGYTSLNDNQIKVYLTDYNNTQKVSPTLVSNLTNYKLYTGKHSHDATHETIQDKFKLRVWIDESVTEAARSWTTETKLQYKFKIGITSEEREKPTYVYRYGSDYAYLYNPLTAGTYNGYCYIDNSDSSNPYNSCSDGHGFISQESCNTYITNQGMQNTTCESGTWTVSESIPYTNDATTLNKQFYLRYVLGTQTEVLESYVCYILNDTEYCLKGGDGVYDSSTDSYNSPSYESNKQILNESFGASNCGETSATTSPYYMCSLGSLTANAGLRGDVGAAGGTSHCLTYINGNSYCDE